ncbi:hypothetical protein TNIN_479631 [Trichonephila inaurata madagascariensis]|uniref:Uncharacterized protein n=1 Tax=Trichonephila inaurata madagascariensis TaxID=2747483 RepID=A0A8X6MBJ6_9ARAC|nr:hypothetical protein TNIN_329091 [Trichonephila inaurata madagascariensis]GFY43100.1 hypothetical protein TNIN_479631 [Trichonephila inaurata madagascariensis]
MKNRNRLLAVLKRERLMTISRKYLSCFHSSSLILIPALRSEFLICPRSEGTVALFSPPEIIIYEILMDFALAALEAHRSMHAKVAAILFMIFPSLGAFLRYPQFSRLARL